MCYNLPNQSLTDYQKFHKSQGFVWRVWNQIRWRFGTIWAGITGGMIPGEKLLLHFYDTGAKSAFWERAAADYEKDYISRITPDNMVLEFVNK